ncbi:MAG: hypothetical protein CFH44_00538 [Proteobacteria bacterium]|nr:MAG: hypothetical protein CFH44_00538 [Pseudomonadota bacterium]|tara:strand:+ start:659 stop:1063 length:405 start_codon:yes stop_codon:yes gene_type:complete
MKITTFTLLTIIGVTGCVSNNQLEQSQQETNKANKLTEDAYSEMNKAYGIADQCLVNSKDIIQEHDLLVGSIMDLQKLNDEQSVRIKNLQDENNVLQATLKSIYEQEKLRAEMHKKALDKLNKDLTDLDNIHNL